MGPTVYALMTFTALLCSVLLLRGYRRSRARLLLWSGLCFAGFSLNGALVFVDLVVAQNVNLFLLRNLVALAAVATLLYGLIWDVE